MDSKKYYGKLDTMVNKRIKNGIYSETTDTNVHDLKFQDYLLRNPKDYENYEKVRPVSNHPTPLYTSVKSHKFVIFVNDVNLDQLTF